MNKKRIMTKSILVIKLNNMRIFIVEEVELLKTKEYDEQDVIDIKTECKTFIKKQKQKYDFDSNLLKRISIVKEIIQTISLINKKKALSSLKRTISEIDDIIENLNKIDIFDFESYLKEDIFFLNISTMWKNLLDYQFIWIINTIILKLIKKETR